MEHVLLMKRMAALMLLAVVSAACASAQARGLVDSPPLDVPEAPPRAIEKPQDVPEPVGELPPVAAAPPRSRSQAPAQPPAREPAKSDPKPETPAEPQAAAPAASILRTPGTADIAGVSRQVRDVLERARKTLDSIDYRRLTKERRAQYDGAKLMIAESEDAVKAINLEYARNLADKAERLARELLGR